MRKFSNIEWTAVGLFVSSVGTFTGVLVGTENIGTALGSASGLFLAALAVAFYSLKAKNADTT